VWQVADATWGAVHQCSLAKLCALGDYSEAEQLAMKRVARHGRLETATASALAVAIHDLACVFQVQGKFGEAVSARERFQYLARKVIEHRFPGILAFCEEMRGVSRAGGPPWPKVEWHPALYELTMAEESLATAYEGARRLEEALASREYAMDVAMGIGDTEVGERNQSEFRRLKRLAAALQERTRTPR
jgi:hypothetical protein